MSVGAGQGAVQSLHAYATALETAMGHVSTAESMPVRKFFADGQRRERVLVLNAAGSAFNDAYDAASHLRDIAGIRFVLDAKAALIDAKLAYRSLDGVPTMQALRTNSAAELARVAQRASLVAGLAPGAGPAERAPIREALGRAIAGDDAARTELRDSILAGVTSDRVIRAGDHASDTAGDWTADAAIADELVARITATGDAASADSLLRTATAGWSSGVGASVLDQTATTPNDARALVNAARRELARFDDSSPAVRTLIASTRDLVDRNAQRLASNAGANMGTGYLDHPDYAELGRVQASLRLLRSFEALQHAPVPAAPVAAPPAAAVDGAGERLSW